MKTLEIVGEENFQKIAQEFKLSSQEQGIIREIFQEWDELMSIPDFLERQKKKATVVSEKLQSVNPARYKSISLAVLRIGALFMQLSQNRQ